KGIGRTLLKKCYEVAAEQGFQKMRLEVVGGTPAVAVYEKQGFVHECEFPYGDRTIRVMRRQCNEKSD
ncbi:MAG: GNAT family N-acetyltransferase, partial [Planctomycetota bacterium]